MNIDVLKKFFFFLFFFYQTWVDLSKHFAPKKWGHATVELLQSVANVLTVGGGKTT